MRKKKTKLFLTLFSSFVMVLAIESPALAQSAVSVLKKLAGLQTKEREQKLIEGAKKEGKVVVYSFTVVD